MTYTIIGSLDDVLTDAIIKDKVKFMELILQQGVFMKEFLTVERLERLYNQVSWMCGIKMLANNIWGHMRFWKQQLLLSADNISKQFWPRSGPTQCRSWSGSKLFDILIVFLKWVECVA